jgi:hypothetical protein
MPADLRSMRECVCDSPSGAHRADPRPDRPPSDCLTAQLDRHDNARSCRWLGGGVPALRREALAAVQHAVDADERIIDRQAGCG